MDKWITAGGYILAAAIAGAFVLWNNRQQPHEVLKTMVEIHEKLPESAEKDAILAAINTRIGDITSPRSPRRSKDRPTSSLDRELESNPMLDWLILGFLCAGGASIGLLIALIPEMF